MGYQKIIKLLDAARNQPSKFSTRNWVEINDESKGMHNTSNQIKFETSMIMSNLCHYSDTYMLKDLYSPKHWNLQQLQIIEIKK